MKLIEIYAKNIFRLQSTGSEVQITLLKAL